MQRDMELIRKILLAVEQHEHGFAPRDITIDGYTEEQIGYHCYLIGDAEFADVIDLTNRGSEGPEFEVRHLTWAGHEFLDAAKDDTIWNKAKQRLASAGMSLHTVTIGILQRLLTEIAKQQLGLGP